MRNKGGITLIALIITIMKSTGGTYELSGGIFNDNSISEIFVTNT